MKAIGLSGFALSGKTTAANYIEQKYGFRRVHIATTLRKMCAELLRDLGYGEVDIYDILEGGRKDGWIIPELGVTSRYLQIKIGTEFGREMIHPDIWVKTWTNLARQYDRVMNDSVRFPNEEEAIQYELDGFTILIDRPETQPAAFKWNVFGFSFGKALYDWTGLMWGVHDSECLDRLNPSWIVDNSGSLDDLYRTIDEIMKAEGIEPLPMSMRLA